MRETIQTKLNELNDIDSGNFMPDDLVENNKTYFGYQIQSNHQDNDLDKKDTIRVSLIGFIARKNDTSENTLEIIDKASNDIKNKLKELNFKISLEDITLTDNLRKIKVTGYAYYNEINNKLII